MAMLWTIVATIVVGTNYARSAQEGHDLVKLGFVAFRNRPNDNVVSIWNMARNARKQAVVVAIVATYSLMPSLDRPLHKLAEHVRQFKYSDSASRGWTDDGVELASHLQ